MKTMELKELKNLAKTNRYFTFDYTGGGLHTESAEIQDYELIYHGENSGYIYIYPSEESLFENLLDNIQNHMDLTQGSDDQYYDYSPSQVDAIIFAIPQLTKEHQDTLILLLVKHLQNFFKEEDQDEDMIESYEIVFKALLKFESNREASELQNICYIILNLLNSND